jgi:CheY-like chemotaxis protein
MVIGIVVVTILSFILVDLLLRVIIKKFNEAKTHKERQQALDSGLKIIVADEAKTLKRVRVEKPRASILAIDDEEIVLDSFRKILVLDGFSVDTVESGPEALMLVKRKDYDFVFTDLKMPGMDGVEVTKAVKHLRPDIDVIVITGYATIETAVETMKYGAMDYVQKPFTEDELTSFVNKFLIKRQDRIERKVKPTVNLITSSSKESDSIHEFNVPSGVFISSSHTWGSIEQNGLVKVGLDDFVQKIIGPIDEVVLPRRGEKVSRGNILFSVKQGKRVADFLSPVSGKIKYVNEKICDNVELLKIKPYEHGWVCYIEASDLGGELHSLKIGSDAVSWYQKEIEKYVQMISDLKKEVAVKSENKEVQEDGLILEPVMDDALWEHFSESFLKNKH